ncbi:MAG TPA: tRNA (5-methylaminomethyl-2-thiouridine)(34)-methyltransferase MnmD [Saprospiraceae bacterium]|nr:tRNA (5-methylaminomethyl-2-thiouridine)(34)-methyltransferase MnmD [Saprospiraceae bacterium]HMP23232.1 tRNA (5-methylaminomethyl-2-thiouridine)(34)-methyltransferase MnmD [Saprospiraceae bacterium]
MQDLIFETQDGSHSILSQQYGVSYHSKYGAVQESRHVFIEAGLYHQTSEQKSRSVLEFGFGSGLNALLSLLEAERHGWHIQYETLEAYPISLEQVHQLNYPARLDATDFATAFRQMHTCPPNLWQSLSPHFTFRKLITHFENAELAANSFDIVYFDAFAPGAQPELWDTLTLGKAYTALRPGGILVTYCAKGSVKRTLKSLGFVVEALPGPPGKREMTRAFKP